MWHEAGSSTVRPNVLLQAAPALHGLVCIWEPKQFCHSYLPQSGRNPAWKPSPSRLHAVWQSNQGLSTFQSKRDNSWGVVCSCSLQRQSKSKKPHISIIDLARWVLRLSKITISSTLLVIWCRGITRFDTKPTCRYLLSHMGLMVSSFHLLSSDSRVRFWKLSSGVIWKLKESWFNEPASGETEECLPWRMTGTSLETPRYLGHRVVHTVGSVGADSHWSTVRFHCVARGVCLTTVSSFTLSQLRFRCVPHPTWLLEEWFVLPPPCWVVYPKRCQSGPMASPFSLSLC